MSDTLERLRALNKPASSIGGHLIPVEHTDLDALLDIAEAAQEVVEREARSEYSSIYAAPGEFALLLRAALAALDSTGGAER